MLIYDKADHESKKTISIWKEEVVWFLHENINHIHKLGWNSGIDIDVHKGDKDM